MDRRSRRCIVALVGLVFGAGPVMGEELPCVYENWESFYQKDGLPSDKVFCVTVDEDRVWVGTDRGLGLYQEGSWTTYTTEDGLAYNAVLSIAVDPETRDVWAGTMGGLTQISAGRFRTFDQFNSGLPNDVVFGVAVENQNVWVATTTGEGRYRVREDRWDVYTPENAPQHEPWGYSVDFANGKLWAALWGGGALEFNVETERWQSYMDPDGEMEIDRRRARHACLRLRSGGASPLPGDRRRSGGGAGGGLSLQSRRRYSRTQAL